MVSYIFILNVQDIFQCFGYIGQKMSENADMVDML